MGQPFLCHVVFLKFGPIGLILDLERKRRNVSFDAEIVLDKELAQLDISEFKKFYEDKVDEVLDIQTLRKLNLVKEEQGMLYPTNALVLFSNDAL